MNIRAIATSILCGIFTTVSFGATFYVSSTATGGGDGSELNPYTYKEGIAAARDNDVVQLLAGEYKVNVNTEVGNQDPFNVYNYDNVTIVGDVEHPENVVLNAHGAGVRFLGIKKTTNVRGITFTNQYATTDSYTAIWGSGGTLNMDHCVFVGITNTSFGAGICLKASGGGVVKDCKFIDCKAGGNGGIVGTDNDAVTMSFADCRFIRCEAPRGGALYRVAKCISDCEFDDCSATTSTGGGAICNCAADAAFTNCVFRNCSASDTGKYAGAVYLNNSAEFVGCIFENSVAGSSGGAIYTSADLTMIDCRLCDSYSPTHGGAVFQSASKTTRFTGCTFSRNVGQYGGAVGVNGSGLTEFSDCTFIGNTNIVASQYYGAAICLNAAGTMNIQDCRFLGNKTSGSGLIAFRNADPVSVTIEESVFVGNVASRGACVMCEKQPISFMMRNCLCVSNVVSTSNGGICLELKATAGRVENCTFADNKSLVASGNMRHAPLEVNGGAVNAANCVFVNNLDSAGTYYATYVQAGTLTVDYSAYDLTSGNSKSSDYKRMIEGEHNVLLSASPFKDAENGDYSLAKKVADNDNPCLGAGVKLDWMTADSLDLAGHPRLREGDLVDLGCYEYFEAGVRSGLLILVR